MEKCQFTSAVKNINFRSLTLGKGQIILPSYKSKLLLHLEYCVQFHLVHRKNDIAEV